MVSVSELSSAQPVKWRDAADDAIAAAKQCEGIGSYARDDVAATLRRCWVGDTGSAARGRFVKHADDYDAAAMALRAMAKAYDDLADDITNAQRDLTGALDYASAHELKVDDSGRVQLAKTVAVPTGSTEHLEPLMHAQGIIDDALSKASRADTDAARALRTVDSMPRTLRMSGRRTNRTVTSPEPEAPTSRSAGRTGTRSNPISMTRWPGTR